MPDRALPRAWLDADLVERCRQVAEPQIDMLRASGAFAPEAPVLPDASTQVRRLGMLGRREGSM